MPLCLLNSLKVDAQRAGDENVQAIALAWGYRCGVQIAGAEFWSVTWYTLFRGRSDYVAHDIHHITSPAQNRYVSFVGRHCFKEKIGLTVRFSSVTVECELYYAMSISASPPLIHWTAFVRSLLLLPLLLQQYACGLLLLPLSDNAFYSCTREEAHAESHAERRGSC